MSSLPVHLKGQSRSCGATTVGPSASNVFVNNIPVSLQDDTNSHGAGGLISGQGTEHLLLYSNLQVLGRRHHSLRQVLCLSLPSEHEVIYVKIKKRSTCECWSLS